MLQGSAHYVNSTLYYCHFSCDLLNAGTVKDYLREVTEWVADHPFDVITTTRWAVCHFSTRHAPRYAFWL